ncbi:MAG: histidinol-phosphate transaminase [Odoribacteraceae bacterium]|jgi:histidinol-phosphate aminotransferase|nr:histidinol-phosphate transaminase [Odoribacteraceae bacterium]
MKTGIEGLIRENILALEPYTCARQEFSGTDATLLDANESPYDTGFNRYPDPFQRELKRAVARVKGLDESRLVLGNGSDELIDMLVRVTCEPGRDNMIVFSPSYAMYGVCGRVNGVETRVLDLDEGFEPRWDALLDNADEHTRLIFLCSPNNPTGNRWSLERTRELAGRFNGWLVVDEAYMDFAEEGASAVSLLADCPRVVVLQTLSKAWGMAGLRVGICIADPALVAYLNRVKPPYNIGSLTQRAAIEALADEDTFHARVRQIVGERERLFRAFSRMAIFSAVYPSEANFILVQCAHHESLRGYLAANGIIIRGRHIPPLLAGGLRVSVGTPGENDRLLTLLEQWKRP